MKNGKILKDWPVLTEYDQEHLKCVALPLGGIGTGTISLGGRGDLRHWEIVNRPNKDFNLRYSFFCLYAKCQGETPIARALEGQLTPPYEGPFGSVEKNAGLPRFRNYSFQAAYPFGQVLLDDPNVPVDVRIQAFNPLVPGDLESSSIPVAVLRFVVTNKRDKTVSASVCGNLLNFIGTDGISGFPDKNRNQFRKQTSDPNIQGLFMESAGVDTSSEQYGTMALTTTSTSGISYRTSWANRNWANALLDFWEDFRTDGILQERKSEDVDAPQGSLAVSFDIPPRATKEVTFFVSWHFPNRMSWTPEKEEHTNASSEKVNHQSFERIGNYYTTQYRDAWDVALRTAKKLSFLEGETLKFVRALCESDYPAIVKEAALCNLSTLRTQTCFRTEDGHFFGWEGCCKTDGWQPWDWGQKPRDYNGSCHGSCNHVWNYEQATAFLFGDLSCSMRKVEFLHATRPDGHMSFRVNLPLKYGADFGLAAADGQLGCIMKLYRDWQLSGDDNFLLDLWPKAKKTLEFCWITGGWDANTDGVMEGCQHNTMDVEYYGPNPQIGIWYLGALRASEQMARYLKDYEFADTCNELYNKGARWIDENLFNGEYYEQHIIPPLNASNITKGLLAGMGSSDLNHPELQLGSGCLVDQLVGQCMAHICGLKYLLNKDHIQKTLKNIMKYNFNEDFTDRFNNMRAYVLNDESGLLMATYPHGCSEKEPFPYFNEVMTGFEYTAAVGMIYEGQIENALKCIKAIRQRYDGRKRNPFDEAECGHHYARAMASWAAIPALTGFHYSAVNKTLTFSAQEGCYFWSNGYAWGICRQTKTIKGLKFELKVLHGFIKIKRVILDGFGQTSLKQEETVSSDRSLTCLISPADGISEFRSHIKEYTPSVKGEHFEQIIKK